MAPEAPRPRIRTITGTGTALAVSLAPLVIGVLMARTLTLDPHTPVNALITRNPQGTGVSPAEWRDCGRNALRSARRWRPSAPRGLSRRPGAGRRRPGRRVR
ncbi:hypothetical protein ACWC1D_34870 [Streptomyces sp. NPDC001478]